VPDVPRRRWLLRAGELQVVRVRPRVSARPRPPVRAPARRPRARRNHVARRAGLGTRGPRRRRGRGRGRGGRTVTTLFDQAAREAIAHDLDHTLFVEAGAGTGKTSALVARLVALVWRGTPLTQIAAITFTEAAAAELRERVREALGEAAISDAPG